MEVINEYKNKNDGTILRIFVDENPLDPRRWDNLGVMVCRHSHYNLGDEQDNSFEGDFDEFREYLIKERGAVVILPLLLYDHSGLSISTTNSFYHPWDVSRVGYIFATKEAIEKNFNIKGNISKEIKEKVEEILKKEVETYDQYLRGDIYSFELVKIEKCNLGHHHKELLNLCSGFYGSNFKENGLFDYAGVENIDEWEKVQ